MLLRDDRLRSPQIIATIEEISRDITGFWSRGRPLKQRQKDQHSAAGCSHASPPARSASGVFLGAPGLRLSASLYHLNSAAAAIMISMPNALASTCIQRAGEISVMAKGAAKERKTPTQKISSECCPQTMGGHSSGDFRNGAFCGTK